MGQTMNQDLEDIRHYKGTVADFKNFFDQKAAETANETDEKNTNAFGTPEYQGFNDVHPTRGANASPHWETSNLREKKDENTFKKGDKVIVTDVGGPDGKRFNGKIGTISGEPMEYSDGTYAYMVRLKGFGSREVEFKESEIELDESNSTSTKADRLPLFEDFQG